MRRFQHRPLFNFLPVKRVSARRAGGCIAASKVPNNVERRGRARRGSSLNAVNTELRCTFAHRPPAGFVARS